MSQVSEIKCPVCGKWSNWTGKTGERCPHCDARFEEAHFQYEEERRINTERSQQNRYLVIKETDDTIVQMGKQFINWLKWTTLYGLSIVYVFLGLIIVMFGLIMLL